jgi:hypothetical protein
LQKGCLFAMIDVVAALSMHEIGHKKLSVLDSCTLKQKLASVEQELGLF